MSNFDLSKPADFAKATIGGLSGILSQFTGKGNTAWDIREGAYTGGGPTGSTVIFHVFSSAVGYSGALSQISDHGGRRKVKFKFPYKDGQTTDDLGRKPQTFQLDILLHGDRYLEAFKNLMTELNDPVPGTLIHPVLGALTAGMEDYEVIHSCEKRKAVAVRLTMTEHNFSVAQINPKDPSARGALSKLLDAFAKIDAAINKIEATLLAVRSLKNQVKNLLAAYKEIFSRNAVNMNATFNPGNTDFPALLPVTGGGANPDGSISTVTSPSDPFAQLPLNQISSTAATALAAEQISKDIQSSRDNLNDIILQMRGMGFGQGSLEFYDEILGLEETAIDAQNAFEKGKQSSQARIIHFVTPRIMSIREVAFEVGIGVNQVAEIDILNPELESTNFIPKGTSLKVAI